MCNCSGVNLAVSTYNSTPFVETVINCEKTRSSVQTLYDRMLCAKDDFSKLEENIYLGKLLTMLNINDYCKYDVAEIESYVTNKNC